MFVCSLRASTLKFFGVIGIAVITLAALIIFVPTLSSNTTKDIAAMNENISFDNIKNAEIKDLEVVVNSTIAKKIYNFYHKGESCD